MYATDGSFVREVQFPAIGTAAGFAGRRSDTETFYTFPSFATPPSIYRYDLLTGKSTLFRQPKVKFDPTTYEVRQVFYKSKDGTQVPMFLAHKKGIQLDGSNPTLLYGYGGFNIPFTPRFSVAWLGWLDMGGVFAVANLRGGSEYGEEWHLAGTKSSQAERLRRFHRRGRMAGRPSCYPHRAPGHRGQEQRRPAGRRGSDAAARSVRRVLAGRRRHGHAALPQVHRRPLLGG